jgi:hypothetical protein
MHLQVAKKFGLPKETMKSELEEMLTRISNTDIAKLVYEQPKNNLSEFISEDSYKEFFDEAIKAGVDKSLLTKAACQVARGVLAAYEVNGGGLLESEDELEEIRKNYGVSRNFIQKEFYESYNKKFK